jgi:hypothetical protein
MKAAWIPGQGVKVDYAAIVEILIQQLDNQRARSLVRPYFLIPAVQQTTKFNSQPLYDG